jgi:hypothetical protein
LAVTCHPADVAATRSGAAAVHRSLPRETVNSPDGHANDCGVRSLVPTRTRTVGSTFGGVGRGGSNLGAKAGAGAGLAGSGEGATATSTGVVGGWRSTVIGGAGLLVAASGEGGDEHEATTDQPHAAITIRLAHAPTLVRPAMPHLHATSACR